VSILLVEDDEEVRTVVGEILRGHGYNVLEAHDGDRALQLSAGYTGVVHLVVTDLVMPHLGGRELIGRMMPGRPDIRVLFVSGYSDDTITDDDVLRADFLEKPFAAPGLVRKVREVLNTARQGTAAPG
jgi:CheY-like chemotaxis protein